MSGLDIFALFVLFVVVVVAVWLALLLGALPGRVAAERGHRQVDAIRVCGWLGLITMGLLWPFALVWAYSDGEAPNLERRIAEVDDRLKRLESDHGMRQEVGR